MDAETGEYKSRFFLVKLIHKRLGFERFLRKVFTGFSNSGDTIRHPEGVHIYRSVDRENDLYEEKVIDVKTEQVVRCVKEPLSKHLASAQRRARDMSEQKVKEQ